MYTGFIVIDAFFAAIIGIFRCLKWMFEGFMIFMTALIIIALLIVTWERIKKQK